MPSLKKSSLLLALAAMVLFSAVSANAQVLVRAGNTSCTATATPPVVRAEGIAELAGDILLTCTNDNTATVGAPAPAYLISNLSVSLNVNVTNNRDFGAGTNVTDAVLVINGNNTFSLADTDSHPSAASTFPTVPGPGLLDIFVPRPHFGRLAANNRLEWDLVNIPVPGGPRNDGFLAGDDCAAVTDGCFPSTTTIRITSMRANASELRVPDQNQFPGAQITAFVSITGPTLIPVTNNVLNVGVPILGLRVTIEDAITAGLQCEDQSADLSPDADSNSRIQLAEGFATAFKTLGVPTSTQGNTQWESGYFAPGSNNDGGARQATRFILRFFNIPAGVTLRVPIVKTNLTAPNNLILRLVDNTDANGAGGTVNQGAALDGDGNVNTSTVSISGGFGVAVYAVVDDNPFAPESVDVDVYVEWEADTANDLPGVGSGQISASFAPLSTVVTSSATAPEPRFVDTGGDPQTFLSILRCTTTLLFPFVTNQAGFDTGIAISNTSLDWTFPNIAQDGSCTLHFVGSGEGGGAAPADQTSTVIAAGEQLVFTISGGNAGQGITGAPGFQGFMYAICQFQYAHGYAFISDGFGAPPNGFQGYLALVIPQDPNGRVPGVPNLHNFGEVLGH